MRRACWRNTHKKCGKITKRQLSDVRSRILVPPTARISCGSSFPLLSKCFVVSKLDICIFSNSQRQAEKKNGSLDEAGKRAETQHFNWHSIGKLITHMPQRKCDMRVEKCRKRSNVRHKVPRRRCQQHSFGVSDFGR